MKTIAVLLMAGLLFGACTPEVPAKTQADYEAIIDQCDFIVSPGGEVDFRSSEAVPLWNAIFKKTGMNTRVKSGELITWGLVAKMGEAIVKLKEQCKWAWE